MWYRKWVTEISRGVVSNNIEDDQEKKEKIEGEGVWKEGASSPTAKTSYFN